jgi:two-component system, OmpR family, sensor histidine kinase KdpD
MMADEVRKTPEDFLDLEPDSRRAILKVYIGMAPGVGKTYKMLEEAHALRRRGVDGVLALIETHGRAETAERIGDLEVIPPKKINYRGIVLLEIDVDAVIRRKPAVAIVDELAHTNAPGSRHEKRYQDVEELLDNGISVITAVNIQHIESLNDIVARMTGVRVRETIPDSFFARADRIVNIDLPAEELRERLREGKIYPPDRLGRALRNFFRPNNLASLRELALREVARSLSRQREQLLKEQGREAEGVSERVMLCLSSNPFTSRRLIRKACRIAEQLNAPWYVVYVETPSESTKVMSTANFKELLDNINLASELGAEVEWINADEAVPALLDFARRAGITKIILGQSHAAPWRRWLGLDVKDKLLSQAAGFDVEVVADHNGTEG